MLELHRVPEIDSTQAGIRRALTTRGRLPSGWTLLAERQTAGRGRLGRSWYAPPGGALLWSTWIGAELLDREHPALVSLAAGLALSEALDPWFPTRLKWPNDLLAPDERKLAGILVEGVWEAGRLRGSIVGIGLNLLPPGDDAPPEVRARAAAAAEWTDAIARLRAELVPAWYARLRRRLPELADPEGRERFAADYNRRLHARARRVTLKMVESDTIVGYIEGIDPTGAILVREATTDRLIRSHVGELEIGDRPLAPDPIPGPEPGGGPR